MLFEYHPLYPSYTDEKGTLSEDKLTPEHTYVMIVNGSDKRGIATRKFYEQCLSPVITPTVLEKDTQFPATLGELEKKITQFTELVTPQDAFIFLYAGHGCRKDGASYFELDDSEMSASSFNELIEPLNPLYSVYHFSQCCSGQFADSITKDKSIVVSSTSEYAGASSHHLVKKDLPFFTEYFMHQLSKGKSVQSAYGHAAFKLKNKWFFQEDAQLPKLRYINIDPSTIKIK